MKAVRLGTHCNRVEAPAAPLTLDEVGVAQWLATDDVVLALRAGVAALGTADVIAIVDLNDNESTRVKVIPRAKLSAKDALPKAARDLLKERAPGILVLGMWGKTVLHARFQFHFAKGGEA